MTGRGLAVSERVLIIEGQRAFGKLLSIEYRRAELRVVLRYSCGHLHLAPTVFCCQLRVGFLLEFLFSDCGSGSLGQQIGSLELGSTGHDQLLCALEHDLETGEFLVTEILDLVTESSGIGLCGVDDLVGPLLRGSYHLGALHHALSPSPGLGHDVLGLVPVLLDELRAFLE